MRRKADISKHGGGDCFVVAMNNVVDDQDLYLCHGIAVGQGPIDGVRFAHAWNETQSGYVIDQSNGNNVYMPKEQYYAIGHIDPSEVRYYNFEEVMMYAVEYGTYGPWDDIFQHVAKLAYGNLVRYEWLKQSIDSETGRKIYHTWLGCGDTLYIAYDDGWFWAVHSPDGVVEVMESIGYGTPQEALLDFNENAGYHQMRAAVRRKAGSMARNRARRKQSDFWNPTPQGLQLMELDGKIWRAHGWESGNDVRANWGEYVDAVREGLEREGIDYFMPGTYEDLEDNNFHSMNKALCEIFGKHARRKQADGWQFFKENITPELEHFDHEEVLEMFGAYTDESYIKVENGMVGVVSHHVGMVDDWFTWDTYAGSMSYGVDCGMCDSLDDGKRLCEESFVNPGFTVGARRKRSDRDPLEHAKGTYDTVQFWYTEAYPTDDLGAEINPSITFEDCAVVIGKGIGGGFYDYIGVGDSLIRERIFKEICYLYGIKYDWIYDMWLHGGDKDMLSLNEFAENFPDAANYLVEMSSRGVRFALRKRARNNRQRIATDVQTWGYLVLPFYEERLDWVRSGQAESELGGDYGWYIDSSGDGMYVSTHQDEIEALRNAGGSFSGTAEEVLALTFATSDLTKSQSFDNMVRSWSRRKKASMFNYVTNFNLKGDVNDFEAAKRFLSEDDMTYYLKNYSGIPQDTADAVDSIEWILKDESSGTIEMSTNRELSQSELDEISSWVSGQNSDGIGESFEQQPFASFVDEAEYESYLDDWEWEEPQEYDYDDHDDYEYDYDDWRNREPDMGDFETMCSFDWDTNDYKFRQARRKGRMAARKRAGRNRKCALWQNTETGEIFDTKAQAEQDAAELYDFGDPTNAIYDIEELPYREIKDAGRKGHMAARRRAGRKNAKYILEDNYGAPQAGVDVKEFDEWWELEEYLDANPDVVERIDDMYATIYEAKRAGSRKRASSSRKRFARMAAKVKPHRRAYRTKTALQIIMEQGLNDFDFWSGAKQTRDMLTWEDLEQIEFVLEDMYPNGIGATELNDLFWFDGDFIASCLGYDSEEEMWNERNAKRRAMRKAAGYVDDVKGFIIDKLHDYEGEEFYGCDLALELTMNENMDGCWIPGYDAAMQFIADNMSYASDTFDYLNDSLGMAINPFENPAAYTFYMLDFGVGSIISQCPYVDERWNDEFTLDEGAISAISQQVQGVSRVAKVSARMRSAMRRNARKFAKRVARKARRKTASIVDELRAIGIPENEIDHYEGDLYVKVSPKSQEWLDEFDVAGTPYTLKIDGMSVVVLKDGREVGVVGNADSLSEYKLVGAISKQIDMPRDDFEREMMQDALFDAALDVIDYFQSGDIFSYASRKRATNKKARRIAKRSMRKTAGFDWFDETPSVDDDADYVVHANGLKYTIRYVGSGYSLVIRKGDWGDILVEKVFDSLEDAQSFAEGFKVASCKTAGEIHSIYELQTAKGVDEIIISQNEFGEWGWQWVDEDGESVIDQDFDYGAVEPVIEFVEESLGATKVQDFTASRKRRRSTR